MKLILLRTRRMSTGTSQIISFHVPVDMRSLYADLIKKCPDNIFDVEIFTPRKKRSTGYRSQNSHTHGHYEDIAEQLSSDDVQYSPDEIGRALKLMAMKSGEWPAKRDRKGKTIIDPITKALEPMSEADATAAESARLIEFIHFWADSNGLWLTEYIDGTPQRVYAGDRSEQ